MRDLKLYRLWVIGLLLLLFACDSTRDGYTSRPTRSLLHPEAELLDAEAVAFHLNDSVTRVFLKIGNDRLLYKRPDSSKVFYSNLKISYQLLPVDHPRIVSDSGSVHITDRSENEVVNFAYLYTHIDVKARDQHNYELDLVLWDINRRTKYRVTVDVIKENKFGEQNFLLTRNDTVAFRTWFVKDEKISVRYTYPQDEMLSVYYFKSDAGPALPPFSSRPVEEQRPKSDSLFYRELIDGSAQFQMPESGYFLIKANKVSGGGLSIYTVDESFPGVSGSKEMIQCTRYIMSKEEYESCLNAGDQKAAIDDFWLNIGGSRERAREMLKKYYGRVMEANKNYSSYEAGWKTDRGMIYIVMGAATKIFKSREIETWVYGNEASANALRFVFVKPNGAYSENDLVLERSGFYRDPYHMAVEYWRQGVVYNDQR